MSLINEPKWNKILNEIFAETHEDLTVSGRAEDLSFSLNEESDLNTSSSEESEENHSNSTQINAEEKPKKKTSCCTAQKEKSCRSLTQELSQLANGMEKIAAVTLKKQELPVERDLKQENMYLAFRREEAGKNRVRTKNCRNAYKDIF